MVLQAAPRRWLLASLILSALALAAGPAAGQAPAPGLAGRFPPGTIVVLRDQGLDVGLDWLAKSPYGRLVEDPEVKPLWEMVTGLVKQFNKVALQRVNMDLLGMLGKIHGEWALGLTRLQVTQQGPVPGVLLALDLKGEAEKFKDDVEALLKLLPEGLYESGTREVKDVPVRTFVPAKSSGRRRRALRFIGSLHMAWVDSVFLLGNDKSAFDRFIQVSRNEELEVLAGTDNWKDTMEQLGGAGDFTFYVNIEAISDVLEAAVGMMPEDAGPIISALGLDQFPALGSSVHLQKSAMTSTMVLRYTGDGKSGIGSLLTFKKQDLTIPDWVPANAMSVAIFNYDFEKAFAGFLGLVQEAGDEPYEDIQHGLEEFRKKTGLSLQDDVFGALAGPVIMVQFGAVAPRVKEDAERGRPFMRNPFMSMSTGTVLFGVRIRDRKPIESVLELLEDRGAEVTEYMGGTIFSPPRFDDEAPTVEVAVTDSHVLFGMGTAPVIRQTLQRMGGRERGFVALQGVQKALAGLPGEGAGLVINNLGREMHSSINMLKMFGGVSKKVSFLGTIPVPSSEIFEKYLGYSAGVVTFEPGLGLKIHSRFTFK